MRQGMATGTVQGKAVAQFRNAHVCPGPQNDDGGGQFDNDLGDVVDGLRVQADGQVPLARFPRHCGHVGLKLSGHRGILCHTMGFIVTKSLGIFPNGFNTFGVIRLIAVRHELHVIGHEEEA